MSVGPMAGLFLHDAGIGYTWIFCASLGSCLAGFCCATLVKTPYKPPVKRTPISLDRFILLKGIPAGISLLLLSIPYGMTTNYVAMYARQIHINASTGFFFTFMALGMAVSRLFSGRLVDRGKITQVISAGLVLVVFSFFLLAFVGVKMLVEAIKGGESAVCTQLRHSLESKMLPGLFLAGQHLDGKADHVTEFLGGLVGVVDIAQGSGGKGRNVGDLQVFQRLGKREKHGTSPTDSFLCEGSMLNIVGKACHGFILEQDSKAVFFNGIYGQTHGV